MDEAMRTNRSSIRKVWETTRTIIRKIPRPLADVLVRVDQRLEISPFVRVGHGDRLVIMDWDEASNLPDLALLVHLQSCEWASKYLNGLTVLDVGCGTGYGAYYLATHGAKYVLGIDVSADAIIFAKKHWEAPNLRFMVMDALNLKFQTSTFDAVVSFQVLEHIYNQEKFISEIVRMLRPSGRLYIGTPNASVSRSGKGGYHVREVEKGEFEELLRRHFNHVKVLGQDVTINGVRQKAKWYRYIYKVNRTNLIIVEDDVNDAYCLLAVCEK